MTKRAKEIMKTEADIREVYEKIHDDFIKCLTRENITDDEKESILKNLDELERIRSDRDRSNSESWYKIGEAVGKNKGIILGAICYASGFAFGKIIMKIISKK